MALLVSASLYWKGRRIQSAWGRRRMGMVLEWFLRLFRWLAGPFLLLTMLEQPPVLFKLL